MLLCHLRNGPVVRQLDKSGRPLVFFLCATGWLEIYDSPFQIPRPFSFSWNKSPSETRGGLFNIRIQNMKSRKGRDYSRQGWLYPKLIEMSAKRRQSASHECVCVCVPRKVYIWRSSSGTKKRISHSQNSLLRAYVCKKECGTTQNSSSDGRLLLVVA